VTSLIEQEGGGILMLTDSQVTWLHTQSMVFKMQFDTQERQGGAKLVDDDATALQ
jgi:hypothetical protein